MAPYLAAVIGGLLMWAAFPPLDWGWFAFIAPAPLLWAARMVDRAWTAVTLGFVFGLVFYGGLLYWISVLGFVAWLPLVVVLSAYAAVYALLVWAFRHWPAGRWWLVVVAGWALWEFVRARFPLGGFPWGSVGYAAAANPGAIGATQWIGPTGWGVLAVAVAAGLVLVIERVEHWSLLVDPAVVVLLLVLAGGIFAPTAEGTPVRSAIVQGGSPCPMTHCRDENRLIFESHLALTQSLPEGSVDLVVWPENSMGTPFEPEENMEVRAALETEARRLGAYLLVSGTRVVDDDEFLNTNTLFAPNGSRTGVYTKRHPVPFGEFVPFRSLFEFVPQLERVPRDMVRGDDAVAFATDLGVIGSVISFEGAFARYVRDTAQAGAQLGVVATNESSFDVGPASDQLIEMVQVNTAAVGQDLLHGAITGKSAIIRADGQIVAATELLEERNLIGVVRMRSAAPTLYTRFGDWVLLVALAGAGLALVLPGEGRPGALTSGFR